MNSTLRNALVFIAKAIVFLTCCSMYLWWAYSMRKQAEGGYRTLSQAIHLTIEMSVLTTVLAAITWFVSRRIHRRATWIGLAIKTALETAVVLTLYTALVIFWREQWTPEKGLSDSAAFMPVVGHINAEFFADFGWLTYLVVVVPFVSLLSGVLTSLFNFLQNQTQIQQNHTDASQ